MKKEKEKEILSPQLTTIDGWALGTGAMMGITVFVVSGQISGLAGPASCLGFLLAALLVMVIALCYSEVATECPRAGGAYMYPKEIIGGKLGDFLSFISGWALWGGQGLGAAIVSMSCADYIIWLIEILGGRVAVSSDILGYILVIFFGLVNMKNIGGGRFIQLGSALIVTGSMILFIVLGGINIKSELLSEFTPYGFTPVWTCVAICLLSYGGWSTIPTMAEDFKNPAKQIPRSIILSLATCGIIFTIFVYVMNGLLPADMLSTSDVPPAEALMTVTNYGAIIIAIGGIFACISTSNGLLITSARIPFSMSREGALPSILSKTNNGGIPYVAIIFTVVGQLILAFTGLLMLIVEMIVFVTSISWLISLVCLVFIRRQHPKLTASKFHAPLYPLSLMIAFVGLAVMVSRLTSEALLVGGTWIIAGMIFFALFRKTMLKKFCRSYSNERKTH